MARLKEKGRTELFLFDPTRRSVSEFIDTSNNPFIKEIQEYLKTDVMPRIINLVDSFSPKGIIVNYKFRWGDEWFIVAAAKSTITKKKIYNGQPEEFIGGKAFFDLIINGKEISDFIFVAEWNGEKLQTNMTEDVLARLIVGELWESPTKWSAEGPPPRKLGLVGKEDKGNSALKEELIQGLKQMGVMKANIDMAKVDSICRRDFGTDRLDIILGKALTSYFYKG